MLGSLPTSLVECSVSTWSKCDFSANTNLTSLKINLDQAVRVTFPTQLKGLCVEGNMVAASNIHSVELEWFRCSVASFRLTPEFLATLPRTLRLVEGWFDPPALEDRLTDFFPLYGSPFSLRHWND